MAKARELRMGDGQKSISAGIVGKKPRRQLQFQLALKLETGVTEEENELTNVLRVLTPVLLKFR